MESQEAGGAEANHDSIANGAAEADGAAEANGTAEANGAAEADGAADADDTSNSEKYIIIKQIDGTSFRIDAKGIKTILDLKMKIEEQKTILVCTQELYLAGFCNPDYYTVIENTFNRTDYNSMTFDLIIDNRTKEIITI